MTVKNRYCKPSIFSIQLHQFKKKHRWLNNIEKDDSLVMSMKDAYQKHFFNPSFLVMIFVTDRCNFRTLEVSVEKEEMIDAHGEEPNWHQD